MLKTNKLRFFKILEKAAKPLKTSKKVKKHHDDCNEKKTHQDTIEDASVEHTGLSKKQIKEVLSQYEQAKALSHSHNVQPSPYNS